MLNILAQKFLAAEVRKVPERGDVKMIKRVLVAVDGSEHSMKAVDQASDIAVKYGCDVK